MKAGEILNQNIEKLENKLYKTEFDISGYFLPKREIVKNIIRQKNPSMIKSDINLMVDGPGLTQSVPGEYSPFPLTEGSVYYKEAERYQNEAKVSAALFMSAKKELTNQLISSLTLLNSSIPGISLMVSAPPWNIPAALSMASLVLDSLNDLISKSTKVLDRLGPLKKLDLLLSEDKLRMIVRILNPAITVIMALLDPIEKIKQFLIKIISKIKSLFNASNCRRQIRRIKRQITKKNKELLKSSGDDAEDLKDELIDLKQQLAEVENKCGKKISLEQDLEQLNSLAEQVNTESDTWIESLTFQTVYDVLLPDGTTLYGITEEQIENLKLDYTILYNN